MPPGEGPAGMPPPPGGPPRFDGGPPPGAPPFAGGPPGGSPREDAPRPFAQRPPRYGLADTGGRVVLGDGAHAEGAQLTAAEIAAAVPLLVGGVERARILMPPLTLAANSPERRFLAETDRALAIAILVAVLLATLTGAWLAASTTRPLRALTAAAGRLAAG